MKKALTIVLVIMTLLALCAPVSAFSVIKSPQNLAVDGVVVDCEKYNIDGNNYFKLRDIAYLLCGTDSQFDVNFNETTQTMAITTGVPYTPVGGELSVGVDNSASAKECEHTLSVDGVEQNELTIYDIGGNCFLRIRELGEMMGFGLDYDAATNTAMISSQNPKRVKRADTSIIIDGQQASCDMYSAAGNLYCKLRDIAYLLNGTSCQFDLSWDAETSVVVITPGHPYQPVGGELNIGVDMSASATLSKQRLRIDKVLVNDIPCYNIGGSNYFRLDVLAEFLGVAEVKGNSISTDATSYCEVFFAANGGSVSPTSATVTCGNPYGPLPTPIRPGYEFAGWFTSMDGGARVDASTVVTTSSDHTLFAHWNSIPAGGGGGSDPQPGGGQDPSLPQLAAPSELTWGVAWTEILQKNEETGQFDIVDNQSSNLPGSASFKNNQPTQNTFRIQFYSVGSDGDTKIYSIQHNRGNTPADYLSFTHFLDGWGFPELPGSGAYYFTVQSLGDGTQYRDSEVVTSPIWSYTAPSTQLPAPDGLAWTANGELSWNRPAGDGILGYAKKYYYRDESNGGAWKEVLWNGYSTHPSPDVTTWKMGDYVLQQNGAGYYAFRVQAVSSDITTIRSSEWSELSPARWFGDGSTTGPTLNEALETVNNVNVNSSDEEKQAAITAAESALNAVGTETLKENLLTDQSGTGATQQLIEKTEELLGTKATPTVAANLDKETTAQLSAVAAGTDVVGAGLNAETGDSVQLRLDKPDPAANHVIPEQFANTVQIRMDLYKGEENITAEHQELAVPVKIRMPVPEGINPDFLVILHHRADGTVSEILHPYLTWEGGKPYANFVLTSFSDFTFAEEQLAAVRTGAGVNVTAKLPDGAETVVCAAYDADGRMLAAASTATFTDGKANVSLLCAPNAVSCVRAFFLNAQQAPVADARSVVPESA